jgi:hypothetical protein
LTVSHQYLDKNLSFHHPQTCVQHHGIVLWRSVAARVRGGGGLLLNKVLICFTLSLTAKVIYDLAVSKNIAQKVIMFYKTEKLVFLEQCLTSALL